MHSNSRKVILKEFLFSSALILRVGTVFELTFRVNNVGLSEHNIKLSVDVLVALNRDYNQINII